MMTMYPDVPIRRVNPDAPIPAYAYEGDAGLDLCSMEDVTLRPGESAKVGCGIAFAIPRGWVGYVYARSGLGMRGLVMKNGTGVVDSTYRGEVKLTLFNNNPTHVWRESEGPTFGSKTLDLMTNFDGTIHVRKGDRVAQIVFQQVGQATLAEVDELDETERGHGGFGSTGVGERL